MFQGFLHVSNRGLLKLPTHLYIFSTMRTKICEPPKIRNIGTLHFHINFVSYKVTGVEVMSKITDVCLDSFSEITSTNEFCLT